MTPHSPATAKRILAVDPGMQYLGVAVLEGEELLWYGIKTFPGRQTLPYMRGQVEQYLAKLVRTYQPETLAIEDPFYEPSLGSRNHRHAITSCSRTVISR